MNSTEKALEKIYETIHDSASVIESGFSSNGYDCYTEYKITSGKGGEICHFPLPVITVTTLGSVTVGLDYFIVSVTGDKNKMSAIKTENMSISKKLFFEIYSADDEEPVTVATSNDDGIYEKIMAFVGDKFVISVYIPCPCDYNRIREALGSIGLINEK